MNRDTTTGRFEKTSKRKYNKKAFERITVLLKRHESFETLVTSEDVTSVIKSLKQIYSDPYSELNVTKRILLNRELNRLTKANLEDEMPF
jgi:hypothetical protein